MQGLSFKSINKRCNSCTVLRKDGTAKAQAGSPRACRFRLWCANYPLRRLLLIAAESKDPMALCTASPVAAWYLC